MQISVQKQLAKEQMGFHCSTAYQATPPFAFLICIFLKCNRKGGPAPYNKTQRNRQKPWNKNFLG